MAQRRGPPPPLADPYAISLDAGRPQAGQPPQQYTGYMAPRPVSSYVDEQAVVLPPGAAAWQYAQYNVQQTYVAPGGWQPSQEALAEAQAQADFEEHPMEQAQPASEAPDGQAFLTSSPGADGKPPKGRFLAPTFTHQYDVEAKGRVAGKKQQVIFERPFKRKTRPNIIGWLLMFLFLSAFIFYIWVRAAKTLNLGPKFEWYGILILVLEAIGATTTAIYGINHLWYTVNEDILAQPMLPMHTAQSYHIRVLVPCYKESIQILQLTIMGLLEAVLPENCTRTIYMCDDGKDPLKRDWVDSLGPEVIYVSGRVRKKGEMNGKSGNMNNVLMQIYPNGSFIPSNELIAVFDADQIAKPDFFIRTVPMFDAGDDIGMVLTPQFNSNLSLTNDIFNHSNTHFWQYMQPGYDALDFISCTGTNFLVRANAYQQAGWTPTWTLTEDFALGMEMKRYGWHCRYLNQYLAVGEAPDGVRNCFQQRSRWTKGHFQIMLSRKYCPLFRPKLPLFSRFMYCTGVWAYCVNALLTPIFMLVPVVTIWVGVFPMRVNFWLALASTIFFSINNMVLYYFKQFSHISALWFAGLANQLFWWTYAKAWWRSFTSACCCSNITFKATAKGGSKVGNSAARDLWIHVFTLVINTITVAAGLFEVFTGATIISPLLISIVWCIYNMIPPCLVLTYALWGRKKMLSFSCFLAMIMSSAALVISLGLVWWIQATTDYSPEEFTGGVGQSDTYIGMLEQIKKWVKDGWSGIVNLTG